MAEYIEREKAKEELLSWAVCINHPEHLLREDALCVIDNIPAADVEVVVHCYECVLHGHCRVEDTFEFAEMANPFCCVGKRRTNQWT